MFLYIVKIELGKILKYIKKGYERMKKNKWMIASALIVILCMGSASAETLPATEPAAEETVVELVVEENVMLYEKSGVIYDFETMKGIPGVQMCFTCQLDGVVTEIITDEDGYYTVQLKEGKYWINLKRDDYLGAEIEMYIGPEPPMPERR